MVKGEHLRPLLGFAVVCVTAVLIMGTGLNPPSGLGVVAQPRAQVREVPGTTDLVLGQTLDTASPERATTASELVAGRSRGGEAGGRGACVVVSALERRGGAEPHDVLGSGAQGVAPQGAQAPRGPPPEPPGAPGGGDPEAAGPRASACTGPGAVTDDGHARPGTRLRSRRESRSCARVRSRARHVPGHVPGHGVGHGVGHGGRHDWGNGTTAAPGPNTALVEHHQVHGHPDRHGEHSSGHDHGHEHHSGYGVGSSGHHH